MYVEADQVCFGLLFASERQTQADRDALATNVGRAGRRAAEHRPDLLASILARPVHDVAFDRVRHLVADDGGQGVRRIGVSQDSVEHADLAVRVGEGVDLVFVEHDDFPIDVRRYSAGSCAMMLLATHST